MCVFFLASCFTVAYSFRLFFCVYSYSFLFFSSYKFEIIEKIRSNLIWLFFLCVGGVFFGFISFFFFFREEYLRFYFKIVPLLILILRFFVSFFCVKRVSTPVTYFIFFFNILNHRVYNIFNFFFSKKVFFFEFFFLEKALHNFFSRPVVFFSYLINFFYSFSHYFLYFFTFLIIFYIFFLHNVAS